ncbi:hypothetical protein NE237_002777 [Protea cynaroides]|uniref:Tf2-1-like SH3-like domain-containing protein n=1 Tax=Protea cynaroides TaxID=273540 RepID=A0A9Q0KFG9_9MAGN|nr:hypothetical protein NE237_002777 [Protea cynaroides]
MRQRRWLELLKDYDCDIQYHPGKLNIVVDALSRKAMTKSQGEVSTTAATCTSGMVFNYGNEKYVIDTKDESANQWFIHRFSNMFTALKIILDIVDEVKTAIKADPYLRTVQEDIENGRTNPEFTLDDEKTDGQSERTIQILEDMLRACVIDFKGSWDKKLPLIEFAYNNSYQATIHMSPYEALYGRKCRTPLFWNEVGERTIVGLEFMEETCRAVDIIKERVKIAQNCQKQYADTRRRDLEFAVGDKVFLKVSPMRGLKRFGEKAKLSPRYVGPYEILAKREKVAYQLALPPSLSSVNDVFHISLLKKYVKDPTHVLTVDLLELTDDLTFVVMPTEITSRKV